MTEPNINFDELSKFVKQYNENVKAGKQETRTNELTRLHQEKANKAIFDSGITTVSNPLGTLGDVPFTPITTHKQTWYKGGYKKTTGWLDRNLSLEEYAQAGEDAWAKLKEEELDEQEREEKMAAIQTSLDNQLAYLEANGITQTDLDLTGGDTISGQDPNLISPIIPAPPLPITPPFPTIPPTPEAMSDIDKLLEFLASQTSDGSLESPAPILPYDQNRGQQGLDKIDILAIKYDAPWLSTLKQVATLPQMIEIIKAKRDALREKLKHRGGKNAYYSKARSKRYSQVSKQWQTSKWSRKKNWKQAYL